MGKPALALLVGGALLSAAVFAWRPTAWETRDGGHVAQTSRGIGKAPGVTARPPGAAAPSVAGGTLSTSPGHQSQASANAPLIPDPNDPTWFATHAFPVQVCNGGTCASAYLIDLADGRQITVPADVPGGVLRYACAAEGIPSGTGGCP